MHALFYADVLWLLQNAKFDLRFLLDCGIDISKMRVYDTFLAECILTTGYENRELALDDLAWRYAGVQLDKSIRGNIHKEGLSERVIRYAADDVRCLGAIRDKQLEQIKNWGLENVLDLENQAVKVYAQMEYYGVHLDREKWLTVADITEQNTRDLEAELDELVYREPKLRQYIPRYVQADMFTTMTRKRPDIVWSSPAQKLKVVNKLMPSDKQLTSTLDRFLQRHKKVHPIIPKLIDYAKQAKLASSFGKDFLKHWNPKTSRIHPTYWQILSTGRISAKDPNVNQIPSKGELAKAIRAAFTAPIGFKIVGGDFSGMELRIIAQFSQDPLWLKSFQDGLDLHSVLCAATFGIDIKDVKQPFPQKPELLYRDVQKTINFGLAYGMTEYKLADTMQIPVEQAKAIIDRFFAAVPDVAKFLKSIGKLGTSRNYIRTGKPYRRVRFFDAAPSQALIDGCGGDVRRAENVRRGEIERASMNAPIQGTNGDIIKLAIINVQKYIDDNELDIRIVLTVYDEIQTECPEDIADWWAKELSRLMIEAAQTVITSVPVVVDCTVNDHWSK